MKYSETSQVQKLKHLTHLEDLVLEAGLDGVHLTIDLVEDLLAQLGGNTPSKLKSVTMKFDGAPAVVAGINPENDRFFVATKSLFGKEPKINYTEEDIQMNHGHAPGLVEKLKTALTYLPAVIFQGIYQGDFMYSKDDLETRQDNDVTYIVFKPNTLIYAVPLDSETGQKIVDSEMGFVIHTKYEGNTIADLKATFSFKPVSSDVPEVLLFSPTVQNLSGELTFSKEESDAIDSQLEAAVHKVSSVPVNIFHEGSPLSMLVSTYKNANVRSGKEDSGIECIRHMNAYVQKEIDSKKTPRGVESAKNLYQDVIRFTEGKTVPNPSSVLDKVFEFQRTIASIKYTLIQKLESVSSTLQTYLPQGEEGGWKKAGGEGFVISDIDGNVVKLVDRSGFSAANFLQGAFQKQKKVAEKVNPDTFTKVDRATKKVGLEPDTRVPPVPSKANLIYRDPEDKRAQKVDPLVNVLTKTGVHADSTYKGTTPAVLINDEDGTSTVLLKNKGDLVKSASAKGSVEDIHLTSFRASVRKAVKSSPSQKINLKIGTDTVRNVVDVQKVKGDRVKADFVIIDDTGEPVYWISHKDGTNALGFQQYGGLTDFVNYPGIGKALEKKLLARYPDGQIPKTTRVSFELKNPEVGLLSMYGRDYGSDQSGENNVNVILQGELILEGSGQKYTLLCSHIFEAGELPDVNDPYYPVLVLTYRNSRPFVVGNTSFMGGRVGVYPRAYAKYAKG